MEQNTLELGTTSDHQIEYTFQGFKSPKALTLKIIFIVAFFILTPTTLIASLFSLNSMRLPHGEVKGSSIAMQPQLINSEKNYTNNQHGVQIFASLPAEFPEVAGEVVYSDGRAEMLRQYLDKHNSPLEPLSEYIVSTSDKYDIDYRLLVAISRQESNLCKIIPEGSHNCWGWGIHSKGSLGFDSFEEGIETVSKGIKEKYMSRGLHTPDEIMTMWVPHSPEGAWAVGVNTFMSEME